MEDVIEVEIALLRNGIFSPKVLARMRLTPLNGGGHSICVHSGEDATFWESRGFLAAHTDGLWRLIKNAAAWAAVEWEKKSKDVDVENSFADSAAARRPSHFRTSAPERDQVAAMPPSTSNTVPAMYEASGDEMNTMAFAISSGVARRPNGTVATGRLLACTALLKRSAMTVTVGPGATAFTRIPEFPCSRGETSMMLSRE